MKSLITVLLAIFLLVACGGGEGPELGDFPPIAKSLTDPPFTITPPSSRSPAAFTFTSSNPDVATISGAQVTIHGLGQTTITAAQDGIGSYGPTHKSTTLTVTVDCATGQTRVNGACTTVLTCVAPATQVNNQCVAPDSTIATVKIGQLNWMGVSRTDSWTNARDFCAGSVIDKATGWRQPTSDDLQALYKAGVPANWARGETWSSTAGRNGGNHVTVDLGTAAGAAQANTFDRADTVEAYVSCVR